MPIARVQMPDGRIARIEVPEGTTPEQAVRLAQQVVPKKAKDKPTSFLQGVVEGAAPYVANAAKAFGLNLSGGALGSNPIAGPVLGPLLRAGGDMLTAQTGKMMRDSPTRGSTAGRITGAVAASLPTAFVPGGPALAGAVGGVLGSQNINNPGEVAQNALLGAAAGKAGDVIGRRVVAPVARRAVNAVRRPAPAAPPSSSLTTLGRDAVVRAERFKRAGVSNPTTGMVTRDPRAWNFERETAKLPGAGDDMLQSIKNVESDLADAARNLVNQRGGAIGAEETGDRVTEALAAKNKEMGETVSALYSRVREKFGNVRATSLENLKAAQSHPEWADNAQFDDMVAAVNKRLLRYADADGGASGLTVGQAEELRKFIGGLGQNSAQTFSMRRVLQDALDADVLDNIGGKPFAQAREAAAARFSEFSKTLPGKIGSGAVPPERLTTRLLSRATPLKELRAVRQSLTTGTPEQITRGQEALRTIGNQSLDDLFSKGISQDGKVNGTALFKQFEELSPRLRILLGPQAYKQARRIVLAARDATAEVPYSAVNNSNTASAAANLFPGANAVPATGQRLIPGLARRIAGATVGGGLGGVPGALAGDAAAETANKALANRAATLTQRQVAEQVARARDPQAAARAINQIAANKKADEAVRLFAQKIGRALAAPSAAATVGAIPQE